MTHLYKGKYRTISIRKPGWDYRDDAWYYVTINTECRVRHFGRVDRERMFLSDMGCVARDEWMRLAWWPDVELDEWIVMPNHVHGIIRIRDRTRRITDDHRTNRDGMNGNVIIVETPRDAIGSGPESLSARSVESWGVSTMAAATGNDSHPPHAIRALRPSRLYPNSLGSMIGQFKMRCTKRIRALGYADFGWQTDYYDRIIRDDRQLEHTRQYIRNNPAAWWRKYGPSDGA